MAHGSRRSIRCPPYPAPSFLAPKRMFLLRAPITDRPINLPTNRKILQSLPARPSQRLLSRSFSSVSFPSHPADANLLVVPEAVRSPRCATAKIALSRTALPPPVSFLTPADCAVAPTHPPNRNYLFLCLAGTTFAPQRPLVLSATELDPSHPTLTGTESTKVPVEPSVAGPLRQRLRRVAVPPVCRLQPTPGAGCSALGVRNPFEPTPGGEKSPCCPGSTTPSLHSEDANADESVAPSRKRGHNSGSAIRLSAITCVRYPDTAGRILPRSRHKVIKSFRYCLSIFTIKS